MSDESCRNLQLYGMYRLATVMKLPMQQGCNHEFGGTLEDSCAVIPLAWQRRRFCSLSPDLSFVSQGRYAIHEGHVFSQQFLHNHIHLPWVIALQHVRMQVQRTVSLPERMSAMCCFHAVHCLFAVSSCACSAPASVGACGRGVLGSSAALVGHTWEPLTGASSYSMDLGAIQLLPDGPASWGGVEPTHVQHLVPTTCLHCVCSNR